MCASTAERNILRVMIVGKDNGFRGKLWYGLKLVIYLIERLDQTPQVHTQRRGNM